MTATEISPRTPISSRVDRSDWRIHLIDEAVLLLRGEWPVVASGLCESVNRARGSIFAQASTLDGAIEETAAEAERLVEALYGHDASLQVQHLASVQDSEPRSVAGGDVRRRRIRMTSWLARDFRAADDIQRMGFHRWNQVCGKTPSEGAETADAISPQRAYGQGCHGLSGATRQSHLPMNRGLVIVGGGLAAQRCSETLRSHDFERKIRIVGEEPRPPYDRPPLSKGIMSGELNAESRIPTPRLVRG
jgi:hypothetical protein